jgi:hypothetical protein
VVSHIDYATTETHGPFRKVIRVEKRPGMRAPTNGEVLYVLTEMLSCGHAGHSIGIHGPARKRRCHTCGVEAEAQDRRRGFHVIHGNLDATCVVHRPVWL